MADDPRDQRLFTDYEPGTSEARFEQQRAEALDALRAEERAFVLVSLSGDPEPTEVRGVETMIVPTVLRIAAKGDPAVCLDLLTTGAQGMLREAARIAETFGYVWLAPDEIPPEPGD